MELRAPAMIIGLVLTFSRVDISRAASVDFGNVALNVAKAFGDLNTGDFNSGICLSNEDTGTSKGATCSVAGNGLLKGQTFAFSGLVYTNAPPQVTPIGAPSIGSPISNMQTCYLSTNGDCSTSLQYQSSDSVAASITDTIKAGVSTTVGAKATADIGVVKAEFSASVSYSFDYSKSIQTTQTITRTVSSGAQVGLSNKSGCYSLQLTQVPYTQDSKVALGMTVSGGVMISLLKQINIPQLPAKFRLLDGYVYYLPVGYLYSFATGGGLTDLTGFAQPPVLVRNNGTQPFADQTLTYTTTATCKGQFFRNSASAAPSTACSQSSSGRKSRKLH